MAVIAMTREMATCGKDVAAGLADRLGLTVVHHEVVEHDIAERTGMRESEVHRFLEGEPSLLERWKIDPKRLSQFTAQEILEIAAKGNVLIRGWGATYLLRSVPHVVCLRVCAPMGSREDVLMERLGITDRPLARREIERNDAAHNWAIQKLFGINWLEATLYAIVLNTARIPVKECVEHIVRLTESPAFQPTAQSQGVLMDQLVEARVRAALDRRFPSSFDVTVSAGTVTLTGMTTDAAVRTEAEHLVQGVQGVTSVQNNITHIVATRAPPGM